jgi:hypothetical protein
MATLISNTTHVVSYSKLARAYGFHDDLKKPESVAHYVLHCIEEFLLIQSNRPDVVIINTANAEVLAQVSKNWIEIIQQLTGLTVFIAQQNDHFILPNMVALDFKKTPSMLQ